MAVTTGGSTMPEIANAARFSLGSALSESLRYAIPGIGHALKISWWLFVVTLVVLAIIVAIVGGIFGFDELGDGEYSAAKALRDLGVSAVSLMSGAAFLTILARDYVLRESPPRLFPVFWPVLLRYFVVTLLIIAIVIVLALAMAGIIFGLIASGAEGRNALTDFLFAYVPFFGGLLIVGYCLCRLITWTPSRAVDQPQTFGEAWRATAGATAWKILAGLAIIVISAYVAALILFFAWVFLYGAFSQVSDWIGIPIIVLFFAAMLLMYLMFAVLLTVYPATVFKQLARTAST
jgi:hypothetical protein